MAGLNIVMLLAVIVIAFRIIKKDFDRGLAVCAGLLVLMPDYLRISFGGGIPELTVHRALLIILLISWIPARKHFEPQLRVPFLAGIVALGTAQFMSLVFSKQINSGVKSFFVYTLEVVLFFVIVTTSLRNRETILKLLYSVGVGLGVVALLAFYERMRELNIPRQLLLGDGQGLEDVTSTYPHRILLGYAMAMGVPILFALTERENRKKYKRLLWVMLILLIAACYFSNSRGPWSALIAGGVLFFFLGSRATKKAAVVIALLGVVVLMTRPGVRETILSAVTSTFEDDSVKGKSYEYRWVLWHVAFSEVKKSPERTLFGYGGLSTESMDLSDYFEKESGGIVGLTGFTSWDNQMACDLIEFGFVGFIIEAILLLSVLGTLVRLWFRCGEEDRSLMGAFIIASVIYLYAMSNVYIFSPQLKCLFWVLMACGIRFGQLRQTAEEPVPAVAPEPDFCAAPAPADT